MRAETTEARKEEFLIALEKCMGMVTVAAKKLGMGHKNHYNWYDSDLEYKEKVDAILIKKADFVEIALMKLIKDGNPSAIIFAAKTLCRSRGYAEVVKHEGTGLNGEIMFKADYGD